MKHKELTITLTKEVYTELKDTCLALKNVNILGTKYKSVSDDEIAQLISLALKQNDFRKTLKDLKDKAEYGVK